MGAACLTVSAPEGEPQIESVLETHSAADLRAIFSPGVNIVLWRRALSRAVKGAAAELIGSDFESCQANLSVTSTTASVELAASLDANLAADVAEVEAALRRAVGARAGVLELARVESPQCRKFHMDYVGLRALCSYAGPGTELAPDPWVAREHLCTGGSDVEAVNGRIVPDRSRVLFAEPGDVVLLKGAGYPGNRGKGAVHRSPPADELNQRLVLKLTLASELGPVLG